jgi:Flp pilus assembly pilin Flp
MDGNGPPFLTLRRMSTSSIKDAVSEKEIPLMLQKLAAAARSLHLEEDGQTLVEYALIMLMVSIAAVTLLATLGAYPSSVFSQLNADF